MDNDDRPVGRVLSRREMLKLLASVGAAAAVTACAPGRPGATPPPATSQATQPTVPAAPVGLPSCVVRPEQAEGPFFVDEDLNRSDIRSDPATGDVKEGVPLTLTFVVSRIGQTCEPLPGAIVDVWHCDADGVYSGVNDRFAGSTAGQAFLRGYQVTNADGQASFATIYPGWYPGRAVHIHFKIRADEAGVAQEFTSQLYFDDALTDIVFTQPPYAARGPRSTRNEQDGLYRNGGSQLILNAVPSGDGYAATFDIGLDIS